jgi:hypothetical protein
MLVFSAASRMGERCDVLGLVLHAEQKTPQADDLQQPPEQRKIACDCRSTSSAKWFSSEHALNKNWA